MEIYFGQKISNERAHPKMFYFLSMVAITLGLLGLQELSSEVLTTKFLRVNGSYVQGVFYFFGLASILLSIKSFIKTLLLIFLSGKAYNFRLVISLLGIYFKVGNESLLLITSKLYLTILYLALGLSHFVTIFVLYMALPHSELLGQSVLIASLLTLMEHNPFAKSSDFSVYFRMLYNDDGLNQLINYFKERDLFKLINLDLSKKKSPSSGWLWNAEFNLVLCPV